MLGDVQMVAGVAEHDPRRRLADGARYRNNGRLPLANTVSNRATAAFFLAPCCVVTTTVEASGPSM
jgi:hypothetical protein